MSFFIWFVIFVISLVVLIKSADYFTKYSEKIALALKISPFVIGITLVAFGTSLPELATALVANARGEPTLAIANAIGSNITNILLVLGLSAVVVSRLKAERNLIDIDLPLLSLTTMLLIVVLMDRQVFFGEGLLLLVGYVIYLAYAFKSRREEVRSVPEIGEKQPIFTRPKIELTTILVLILSAVMIYIAAELTIKSVIELARIINIATSAIALTAIALGTSLPELAVSLRAVMKGKHDIAIGNIVGSNIFNSLIIVGIPSVFGTLLVDDTTWNIGLPFLIIATLTFIFSGITKRIYRWEGAMFILLYVFFVIKVFNLF